MSLETYVDLVGEIDFDTELYKRRSEARTGITMDMYPPITMNIKDRGFDTQELETKEKKENLPDKKKGSNAKDFDTSSLLEMAPYKTIEDLPPAVKKYSKEAQQAFRKAFNNAYNFYGSESQAFRVAWSSLKRIVQKGKRS